MVCERCIKAVRQKLTDLGLPVKHIELGKVVFEKPIELNKEKVSKTLEDEGFELIDDETSKLISRIKISVINHIHHHKNGETFHNLTDYLEREIGKSYSSLSTTFSKNEGRTIEKFSIQQRIERVKELLIYGEKTISEIAFELGYSSTQYLSNQFKSETGLTPTQFKKLLSSNRKPLDEV
ncbi:MAG TPA: AraC family transcriptional regulator [Balneola sp.]|jgi:AraC family transcriptional regulator|nr:AraC family transcriptional regulator [Bacteroidota bacterium]MAC04789.1 AraC family transcriptional regulator [Balneola sp.]MAO78706.1 AraC family transcriptional regulator [Balneola sp.]MBF64779.1 AraC family transcriptional regulator [Balneola sp.]HAH50256.1 AraC family transcriptional regulator [Balneola sp.]|tara:strand:- start:821 stop:1360 length:540 start_codon:yes stop_codon:yes gene_type:complete